MVLCGVMWCGIYGLCSRRWCGVVWCNVAYVVNVVEAGVVWMMWCGVV